MSKFRFVFAIFCRRTNIYFDIEFYKLAHWKENAADPWSRLPVLQLDQPVVLAVYSSLWYRWSKIDLRILCRGGHLGLFVS